jgi:hypothetical protein
MAIATLADLYDNPKVFTGVVKIRKGMAAQLILDTKSTGGLHKWFNILARDILKRINREDPSALKTTKICNKIIAITDSASKAAILGSYAQVMNTLSPSVIIISGYHLLMRDSSLVTNVDLMRKLTNLFSALLTPLDWVAAICFSGAIAFILGYSLVISGQKEELKRADP